MGKEKGGVLWAHPALTFIPVLISILFFSVRDAYRARGVILERLMTTGDGESLPIADNATEEGRQENHREEITLKPLTT